MHQLVIASNNAGKISEIRQMILDIQLLSLADIGFTADIPEPHFTFEENALEKAGTIHRYSGKNVMADDSGICVHALNNEPGVNSAHYSGSRNDEANLQKVLTSLHGTTDRAAHYKAVICLIWDGEVYYFEGICRGTIATEKSGTGGFGYDPIFIPDGYTETFGTLPPHIKHGISHRGQAVAKMVAFIKSKLSDAQNQ